MVATLASVCWIGTSLPTATITAASLPCIIHKCCRGSAPHRFLSLLLPIHTYTCTYICCFWYINVRILNIMYVRIFPILVVDLFAIYYSYTKLYTILSRYVSPLQILQPVWNMLFVAFCCTHESEMPQPISFAAKTQSFPVSGCIIIDDIIWWALTVLLTLHIYRYTYVVWIACVFCLLPKLSSESIIILTYINYIWKYLHIFYFCFVAGLSMQGGE